MFSPEQYSALREGAGALDRADRGRLSLAGADRRTYLQGLLTNDVAALSPGSGCYAAYLTPQGRMIADMRVFELGDRVLMDLDARSAAPVHGRLSQFIFSEDVEVADITATTAQIGVYGPRAAHALASAFAADAAAGEPAPSADALDAMALHDNTRWDFAGSPAFVLRGDDIGVPGFDVVVPAERKAAFVQALHVAGVAEIDPDVAETTRIEAGRPRFHVDMDEDTIPLEAGIEGRAISLTKGCYVGQEIIIRVLHRGHGRVARRLVGLLFDPASAVPERGASIAAGEREIGTITSATHSPHLARPIALGYVHRDFLEPGTEVRVGSAAAVVTALPFV